MENDKAQQWKRKQLAIINSTNPMRDDCHTGIRTVEDIRTYAEAWQDEQRHNDCPDWGDFTREQAKEALSKGAVIVYSSNDIEQGVFVTTSLMHCNTQGQTQRA